MFVAWCETSCDLTKPRIARYKNTWKHHQNAVFWCGLNLAQEKGLQFYQTRSHVVVLYSTLPAGCIKKAVRMKTRDELHGKVRLNLRLPRVVFKSNSQYGLKIHKTKTQDHLGNHQATRQAMGKLVTTPWITEYMEYLFRQSSTTIRENKVKQLIEMFEKPQAQRIIYSGLETDAEDQKVQGSNHMSPLVLFLWPACLRLQWAP